MYRRGPNRGHILLSLVYSYTVNSLWVTKLIPKNFAENFFEMKIDLQVNLLN